MAKTISGTLNQFRFIGTYSEETGEFTETVPDSIEDFVFDIEDNGICYVTTNQDFYYDEETGAFYLIKEDA